MARRDEGDGAGTVLAVGVIGCGHAGEMHLGAMRAAPHLRIVALTDLDPAAARRAAAATPGADAVADAAALLARPLDAVAILTPPASHVALATAALDAGMHVLLERPLACDAAAADRLAAHTEAAGKRVLMAYNLRFHAHVRALAACLRAGTLGRVHLVRTTMTTTHARGRRFAEYRGVRGLGGGVLLDFSVAHFDLWRHLLGDEVVEVTALSAATDGDDATAGVVGRMRSGTIVTSSFGHRAAEEHTLEVFGEAGRASVALYRADGFRIAASGSFAGSLAERVRDGVRALAAVPRALALRRAGGVYLASYHGLWEALTGALRGETRAVASLDDGRRSLAVALAVIRSADERRTIRLGDEGA